MSFSYVYYFATDFDNSDINVFNIKNLSSYCEKNSFPYGVSHVEGTVDSIRLFFDTEITGADKTNLDAIVRSYVYVKPFLSESIRYEAFVSNDPNSNSNYASISDAFSKGHKSVFVKGTNIPYVESGEIIIPCNGHIYGENINTVTIDFGGSTGFFSTDSNSFFTQPSAGAITLSNNSTVVTGTNFTSINNGNTGIISEDDCLYAIVIRGCKHYRIYSIVSDTEIVLNVPYAGNSDVITDYVIGKYCDNISLKNITIRNSTHSSGAIDFKNIINCSIANVNVHGCSSGGGGTAAAAVTIESGVNINLRNLVSSENLGLDGVRITDCGSVDIVSVTSENNGNDGIFIKSMNNKISDCSILSSKFIHNGGFGVKIGNPAGSTAESRCDFMSLLDVNVKDNLGVGIGIYNYSNDSTGKINLKGLNISKNGNTGLDIRGGNFIKVVDSNFYENNSGMYISGTKKSSIASASIYSNTNKGAILKGCENAIFTGGYVCSNGATGLSLIDSESVNVISNHFTLNGSNGIECVGVTGLIMNSNTLVNNTGDGVFSDSTAAGIFIGNRSQDNTGGYGIRLASGVSGCLISNNLLSGGNTILDGGTGNTVLNNVVY